MADGHSRFNLIEEPWIPLAGHGLTALRNIFDPACIGELGVNPQEKIALLKFFQAIAQAACTPKDDEDWKQLGAGRLSAACLEYLRKHRDDFWLYSDGQPFLQMPRIKQAKALPLGAFLPYITTGNTTVLWDFQREHSLTDAQKALLLVTLSGGGLGGKNIDDSLVLTPGVHKTKTGQPGPWVGSRGYLHHFLMGSNLLQTIWLNILTRADIEKLSVFTAGLGQAPWEKMPEGEACPVARSLRDSLMGRLVPLGKFCLLDGDVMHYTDGITYPSHKEGGYDISMALSNDGKNIKALWADPEKEPWRDLPALLAFLGADGQDGMICRGLQICLQRIKISAKSGITDFGIWAGGIKVIRDSFGGQKASGTDDFVDSYVRLSMDLFNGNAWYPAFKREMDALNKVGGEVHNTVRDYGKEMKADDVSMAGKAVRLFWELCKREAQHIVDNCADNTTMPDLRRKLANFALQAYNDVCPRDTARQLEAWAAHRPNLGFYLS